MIAIVVGFPILSPGGETEPLPKQFREPFMKRFRERTGETEAGTEAEAGVKTMPVRSTKNVDLPGLMTNERGG